MNARYAQQQGARPESVLSNLGPSARIVVLKAGGIGDFLSITPTLRALPIGGLTLVTSAARAPLARRYPCLDRVFLSPPYEGVCEGEARADEVEAFFSAMAGERFDLAIQIHGGGRHSNPFAKRLGARITAGWRASDAVPLDYWLPYDQQQHECCGRWTW